MEWNEVTACIIMTITILFVFNVLVFQKYIDKKTKYKDREFYNEKTMLQLSIIFLGFYWLFNIKKLTEIRKKSAKLGKYHKLKMTIDMFSNFPSLIEKEIDELTIMNRQFKLEKIKNNIKKKNKWYSFILF